MKLYTGFSPNGMRVSAFMQEKGIDIPVHPVDIPAGETRTNEFLRINSRGQVPVLELDDGRFLAESVAICRYLESLYPDRPLFGTSPDQSAFIEMWNRRMELLLFLPAGDIVQHSSEFFRGRIDQSAEIAARRQKELDERLAWLNVEMSDGRAFVAGDEFTVADITAMAMFLLMGFCGLAVPEKLQHVRRWQGAICARPSFPEMPSS